MKTMEKYLAKIAVNKSLVKEFHNNQGERIVYLNDSEEFQIQIFNPYSYIIGVSFSFNSNDVDKSKLLVLKPGERVWLERYLESNNKFVFSTYEVGASEEVKEAIKNNGVLNVYFYKEIKQRQVTITTTYPNITWENNDDIYQVKTPILNNFYSTISTTSANYSASSTCTLPLDTCLTASAVSTPLSTNIKVGTNSCINKKSIETGRIDKGSYSNQNFKYYYGDFESWYFKKETIHILPTSQKQVSSNDLKKQYCHNCGRKLNQKFKFCPYCGAKQ